MGFFTEQAESIEEMAVAKMPEGTKRVRSKTYASTHDIHVDGEHVATISGHQANRRMDGRGIPSHVKYYHVHHSEEGMLKGEPHKDHGITRTETHPTSIKDAAGNHTGWNYDKMEKKQVTRPRDYHSMDDAVEAVVHTHRNNKEFGANHDPRKRWEHALSHASAVEEHNKKTNQYKTAIAHVKALGDRVTKLHGDHMSSVVDEIQKHHDAHVAHGAGNGVSKEKLRQWTHDAHQYTGTHDIRHAPDETHKYGHTTYGHPDHPEHHELAKKAHELHMSTYRHF